RPLAFLWERQWSRRTLVSRVARLGASSIIRPVLTWLRRAYRHSESKADCRFSEMAKSRGHAAWPERHPTTKRRSVLAPGCRAVSAKRSALVPLGTAYPPKSRMAASPPAALAPQPATRPRRRAA